MNTRVLLMLAAAAPIAAAEGQAPAPFNYERAAPLAVADSLVRTEEGVAVRTISFASPKGGRVTGLLLVPPGTGKFPGVIAQHGAPGTAEGIVVRVGMAVAKQGVVVLAIDAPWARRKASPFTFTPQDSVDQVALIIELQRAVDLLRSRPDVDPAKLGYVGRSYGGAMGALFAGVERRLVTYVLQVGDGGLVSHFTGEGDGPGPPSGVAQEKWNRWLAAMEPIEPIRWVAKANAPILFQSGKLDTTVPPADGQKLFQAGREPKTMKWYDSDHGLNDEAMTDLLEWFHRHLGSKAPAGAKKAA
jgi:dienelactone hydrolase